MKIDIQDVVQSSKYVDKFLYVCDYRKESVDKKAIRHIKPTKVIVLNKNHFKKLDKDFPKVYYSENVLVTLNKKDEPVYSKMIAPFDNTGYRSYAGIGLCFFDNLEECIEMYNSQVQDVLNMYENAIATTTQKLMNEHSEISKLKV